MGSDSIFMIKPDLTVSMHNKEINHGGTASTAKKFNDRTMCAQCTLG